MSDLHGGLDIGADSLALSTLVMSRSPAAIGLTSFLVVPRQRYSTQVAKLVQELRRNTRGFCLWWSMLSKDQRGLMNAGRRVRQR